MIQKNDNFLILKLSSKLYDKETIVEGFEELKKMTNSTLEEGEYFKIKIENKDDAEECAYEFFNYLLILMKNKGIV